MIRTYVGVVAAVAALIALPAAASGGTVNRQHIDERFNGSSIDYAKTWAWWGTNQPGLVSFTQANGVLRLDVSAAAQPDFNVSGQTRCAAQGDFDARVDFNLVDWPAQNGVWVSLMVNGGPFNVYRVSWQFDPSEAYGAYLPPAGNSVGGSDTTGTLRITRRGDLYATYYRAGGSWVPIVSGPGPTDDVPFTLAVFNISNAATLSGQPVSATFDNFHVTADRIVCP